MPKTSGQKCKLLYLHKILSEQSDEAHPLSVNELIAKLGEYGISAERKSIYSDLEALEQYGVDLVQTRDTTTRYFVGQRLFDVAELQLLANAVASSKFIAEQKSAKLIQKITSLASVHTAGRINRQIYLLNRRKHDNERIFYNIDRIHEAIGEKRAVSFRYFEYTLKKEKQYRRGGERYEAVPFALCWDDDNYYMIAYYPRYNAVSNFRVDRMEAVELGEVAEVGELREKFAVETHTQGLFSMYSGKRVLAKIAFAPHLIGAVLDRFGRDVALIAQEDGWFAIAADVIVSPAFWGWLFQFGADARVIAPTDLVDAAREEAKKICGLYAAQETEGERI